MTLCDLYQRMREVCCWGKNVLLIENLHAVVHEFKLILLEKETGKKFWRIIIKQELIQATNTNVG